MLDVEMDRKEYDAQENFRKFEKMKNHPMGQVLLQAFELCLRKNKDYANDKDIFANFRESEDMGVKCSKGVAVRLGDKWMRFKKGVHNDWDMAVKDEGEVDTILDIINYASIYHCLYLEERVVPCQTLQEGEW